MFNNITFFSIPKSFVGKNIIHQRNAILSWLSINPKPNVCLLGNETGVKEICNEFDLFHIKDIKCNEFGTPLLNNAFDKVMNLSNDSIFVFINTDIIVNDSIHAAINKIKSQFNKFLIIGHRRDVDIDIQLDFNEYTNNDSLTRFAEESSYIQHPAYKDYFIFTRDVWQNIPAFAVGRASYDNALVYKALKDNIPVIDASNIILALHQNHDYSHLQNGKNEAYNGTEAQKNYYLGQKWTGNNVTGKGYIDSSIWYLDKNLSIFKNDESRDDNYRKIQKLYRAGKTPQFDNNLKESEILNGDNSAKNIHPGNSRATIWQTTLANFPYSRPFISKWQQQILPARYEEGLNSLLDSTNTSIPISTRYNSLIKSKNIFQKIQDNHIATTLSLIRVYTDLGERKKALEITQELAQKMQNDTQIKPDRPFVPPIASFDNRPVQDDLEKWIHASVFEALVKLRADTSFNSPEDHISLLAQLSQNPNHSMQIQRRLVLYALRKGKKIELQSYSSLFKYMVLAENIK